MKTTLVDWLRPAYVSPRKETIDARQAALDTFVSTTKPNDAISLLACFVMNEPCPMALTSEVHALDSTFTDSLAVEGRLLAGASLRLLMGPKVDALSLTAAYGLVASSFDARADQVPCAEHVTFARAWLSENGRAVRRDGSAEPQELPSRDAPAAAWQKLKEGIAANNAHSLFPSIDWLFSATNEIREAVTNLVNVANDATRRARTLAEETNILWWVLGGVSGLGEVPFQDYSPGAAALVAACDLERLTTTLPAQPSALGILHRVINARENASAKITNICTAVNDVPRDLRSEMINVEEPLAKLLPITLAMRCSLLTDGETDWLPVFEKACDIQATKSMSAFALSQQYLVERLFIRARGLST